MLLIMLYFVGALTLAALSWRTFGEIRSHGFMRFLALEAIWAVLVMNFAGWFRDPLSWHQVISWTLLLASALLAIWGFAALRSARAPGSQPRRPGTFPFEETTRLVTSGPYRHIRHPLYTSLLLLAWGAAFKTFTFFGIVIAGLSSFLLYVTAYYEERESLDRFGEAYDRYTEQTRMFIPGLL
jgi:protein-S-isoprenylcysteine O-methyltransferase Ste14